MFPSPKKTPPNEIKIIKGNNDIYFPSLFLNGEEVEKLGEGYFIMLIVKTPMGETVLSKTIVGSEEGTPIMFEFVPTDTIDLAPFHYAYSIDIYTDDGQTFYKTLEKGVFILLHPIGTFKDIEVNGDSNT